jgi:hypothetical protein
MMPIWMPLEKRLGRRRCAGFMFMGRMSGINLYKHGTTRTYLNLDDDGNCFVYRGNGQYVPADFSVELEKLEAILKQQGETLESVYDDEYIARKAAALNEARIPLLQIKVEPEEVKVH